MKYNFITKANLVHNDKYDYSKFVYENCFIKGVIICPIHGEFLQTPSIHIKGCGCKKCGIIKSREKQLKSFDSFVEEMNKIHNNKYDYSKFVYDKKDSKGVIICPIHGEFLQRVRRHREGFGCYECGKINAANSRTKDTLYFIEKSNKIHNNRYDYSKVNYTNSNIKVCIICSLHGNFFQTPSDHMRGNGCRRCNSIGMYCESYFGRNETKNFLHRRNKSAKLYLMRFFNDHEDFYKIGIKTNRRCFPLIYKKQMICEISGTLFNIFKLEQSILKIVDLYKPINNFGGAKECFSANALMLEDIQMIMNLSRG